MDNRAKIVATIGPASSDIPALRKLILAGTDVFRLNFSHGTLAGHETLIQRIREAERQTSRHVAILQDLPGPKIRTGTVKEGQTITLAKGDTITLTTRHVAAQPGLISTSYPYLARDVKKGDSILLQDGLIRLEVLSTGERDVKCRVVFGGELGEHAGINLPGVTLTAKNPTRNDFIYARFGIEHGVDYIAISFVRNAGEVLAARRFLRKAKADIPLIAKIEKPEALQNLRDILEAADGVMVARGDLAVETSSAEVPIHQKNILDLARRMGKMAITATQMLESMIHHPTPTRAEASDVANAVLDGSDALMLSGETAVGEFAVESVGTMAAIISRAESDLAGRFAFPCSYEPGKGLQISEAAAHSACAAARDIEARAIVVFTWSGQTALKVADFRPSVEVLALSAREATLRRTALYWGVAPVRIRPCSDVQSLLEEGEGTLLRRRLVRKGDLIVILVGSTLLPGATNVMKIHRIGSEKI